MVHNSGTSQLSENSLSDMSVRLTQSVSGDKWGVGGATAVTQSIVPERR